MSKAKNQILIDLSMVDWELLRAQKASLITMGGGSDSILCTEHIDGLLALIDYIQDEAEKQTNTKTVFGEQNEEE